MPSLNLVKVIYGSAGDTPLVPRICELCGSLIADTETAMDAHTLWHQQIHGSFGEVIEALRGLTAT